MGYAVFLKEPPSTRIYTMLGRAIAATGKAPCGSQGSTDQHRPAKYSTARGRRPSCGLSYRDMAVLPPRGLGIQSRNPLTANEYGVIGRDRRRLHNGPAIR
jgi:hypothetical protein